MDRHIICDSSALIALMHPSTIHHTRAQATAHRLSSSAINVLIPQEVFHETVQILYNIFDADSIPALCKQFMHSPPAKSPLGDTTRKMIADAVNKFARHPTSARITQYLVMSWADVYQTKEIFGFHPLFAQCGYSYPITR